MAGYGTVAPASQPHCIPQIFPQIFILRSLRVSGFGFDFKKGRPEKIRAAWLAQVRA